MTTHTIKEKSPSHPLGTIVRRFGIICFWLILWQLLSMAIHNSILLVGPLEVIFSLVSQLGLSGFWRSIGSSFGRISTGFLAGFAAGLLTGSLAYRWGFIQELLEPVLLLMKSIPVASFVILALIWIGSQNLAVFVSFTVVYPMLHVSTLSGLAAADGKLLEMAQVFRITAYKQVRYLYVPALLPYLISGCKAALGMSWKSGIAAEVIGVPGHSIGEKLYMAKIYLNTADLFSWTLVIILASTLFEKLFLSVLHLVSRRYAQTIRKEAHR